MMTLDYIESEWRRKPMRAELGIYGDEEERRHAFWQRLISPTERGWFQGFRHTVKTFDTKTLQAWLNPQDTDKQAILNFGGPEAANITRAHLLCAQAAIPKEPLRGMEPDDASLSPVAEETGMPLGFLRDLTQELLSDRPRPSHRTLSLPALLVDEAQDKGVVATLTLELMPGGTGALYPIPELAFVERDNDFRQAEDNARKYVQETAYLWEEKCDARWRLERRDGQPISVLTGPSMGGALALGIAKLFVTE